MLLCRCPRPSLVNDPESGAWLRCSLVLTSQPARVTVLAEPEPLPPDGADGRLMPGEACPRPGCCSHLDRDKACRTGRRTRR